MNQTRRVIIITGKGDYKKKALDIIKGFKAISVVNQLSPEIIENVFRHNKNVVFATEKLSMEFIRKVSPIIIGIGRKTDFEQQRIGVDRILDDFPKLLDYLDVDSGDHISFDSNNNKSDSKKNCFICHLVQGHPDCPEHILYESEHFLVIPGTGAFFKGYVMIVPKRHVMSFAELPEDEYLEFLQVLDDMRFILESVYHKKIFVFECGSGKDGEGKHSTSIVHAHMHLAPTDMPVLGQVQKSGLYPAQIEPMDLIKIYGTYPYMLYVNQEDEWFITSDPKTYFPRQHPRQVLADYMCLKKGAYNWRIYPMREQMDIIANEIYSFLRQEYGNLPAWIQQAVNKHIK